MASSNLSFNNPEQVCEIPETRVFIIPELSAIAALCQHSRVGKLLPNALYVHESARSALEPLLQHYESRARLAAPQIKEPTLIKISTDKPKISYLFYPDFDTNPHPALQASIQVDIQSLQSSYRDYSTSDNPPVLHRKETFVTPDYPFYEQFAELTRHEVSLGLLDNSHVIGTRQRWLQRLEDKGVELQGHRLIQSHKASTNSNFLAPRIERHKAAIARNNFSRPVRLALQAGLFSPGTTFFDYGCGHGGDISRISQQGYTSSGWDPYYSPDNLHTPADVVNLGYVINVIEDPAERREALVNAWELTRKVLLVSAQVLIYEGSSQVAYGDGVITSRNTFQKYYEQEELKQYIDQVLGVAAIPVALGIYFVFRDEAGAQSFRQERYRSRDTLKSGGLKTIRNC